MSTVAVNVDGLLVGMMGWAMPSSPLPGKGKSLEERELGLLRFL